MARKPREKSESGIYHVILRGFSKLIFSPSDVDEFLALFKKYLCTDSCELYAYSIEESRVNLLLKTDDFSTSVKPMCTCYARFCNRIYKNSGKLFYDRFISIPVTDLKEASSIACFIHSKDAYTNSFSEYKLKKILCNTDVFKKNKLINSIVENQNIKLYNDDYTKMSDSKLKKLILSTYNINEKTISKNDLKALLININETANISKSRLFGIFNITNVYQKPLTKKKTKKTTTDSKKTIKTKIEKPANEQQNTPETPKKRELSVWLL